MTIKKQKTKNKIGNLFRAFSLVETLIYISVSALLLVVVVNSFAYMIKSYRDIHSVKSVAFSADVLLNRFSYEVKKSNNLNVSFSATSSSLILNQGTSTIMFSLEASTSRVLISTNGTEDYLTSPETKVSTLEFYKLQANATSSGAVIKFRIINPNAVNDIEEFESGAMIRNFNI